MHYEYRGSFHGASTVATLLVPAFYMTCISGISTLSSVPEHGGKHRNPIDYLFAFFLLTQRVWIISKLLAILPHFEPHVR